MSDSLTDVTRRCRSGRLPGNFFWMMLNVSDPGRRLLSWMAIIRTGASCGSVLPEPLRLGAAGRRPPPPQIRSLQRNER